MQTIKVDVLGLYFRCSSTLSDATNKSDADRPKSDLFGEYSDPGIFSPSPNKKLRRVKPEKDDEIIELIKSNTELIKSER